jgi:hypothetical protein
MDYRRPEVVVTTKNTLSLTLGIISLVLGVFGMLIGWIPFLGLVAIPVALIGLMLAGLGVVVALFKGFAGVGMPVLGGFVSFLSLLLPIMMTGSASVAIQEAAERSRRERSEGLAQDPAVISDKADYIATRLELYDVSAKYTDSFLDKHVPGVFFKIRNNGDRTLDLIRVIAYFKDRSGKTIAEESYVPVNAHSFVADSKPLKPHYVWQVESGKFYAAKSVPSEWEEGQVDVVISDIEFAN